MSVPKVSFVTTVFNGARYLRDAVEAVLATDWPDIEHVIVDDGSTDDSPELARQLAARDRRVRSIAAGRIGRGAALNLAVRSATGALIAVIDVDDVTLPGRLRATVPALLAAPARRLAGCRAEIVTPGQVAAEATSGQERSVSTTAIEPFGFDGAGLYRRNLLIHSTVVYRKTDWMRAGGYAEDLSSCIDYEFYFRLLGRGQGILVPEIGVRFLRNPDTVYKRMGEREYVRNLRRAWRSARTHCAIRATDRLVEVKALTILLRGLLRR